MTPSRDLSTEDVITRHGPLRIFRSDDFVCRCLRELGEFSQSELDFMEMMLGVATGGRYDGVFVDGGAFVGDTAIPMSRLCREVYAFEPHPQTRELLEWNLHANGVTNVHVMPYALGDRRQTLTMEDLHTDRVEGVEYCSIGGNQVGVGTTEVEMIPLDALSISPDFIKADIEGMEIPFLVGAAETLARTRCPVFLECDTVFQVAMPPLEEVLSRLGYLSTPMAFPFWTPENFNGVPVNNFGCLSSLMRFAVPANPRRAS